MHSRPSCFTFSIEGCVFSPCRATRRLCARGHVRVHGKPGHGHGSVTHLQFFWHGRDRAERNHHETRVYVCVSLCHCGSHRLFMSANWCILQQLTVPEGEKEALHVDAFVWAFRISDRLFVSSTWQMHANIFYKTLCKFFTSCPASNHLMSSLCCGYRRCKISRRGLTGHSEQHGIKMKWRWRWRKTENNGFHDL